VKFCAAIMPPLLALTTLTSTTQVKAILVVLHHPKWIGQVGCHNRSAESKTFLPKNSIIVNNA